MGRTLAQGQIFAGYSVERLLGVGGMGEVYLARDRDLPRSVALKVLASGKADDPEVRARFLREADTAARLSHPNIVAVYARGNDDHRLWMAMQYIEGTDVAAVLRDGPLRPDHAVRIIAETGRALDHAHRAGVLHRDVKPANILLAWGPDQRVYLADFGIAKAFDQTSGLTRTGEMYASFQYAAPEQFELRTDTDHRADIYALACTLFHLLTGELPYPGESTAQLVAAHIGGDIPRPSQRNHSVSPAFDAVIARGMAKHRDQRFGSCAELAAAAAQALNSTSGPWLRHDAVPELWGAAPGPGPRPDPSLFTGAVTQPSVPTRPGPRGPVTGPPTSSIPTDLATRPPLRYGGLDGTGPAFTDAAATPPASRIPAPATTARPHRRRALIAAFAVALVVAAGAGIGLGTGAIHFTIGGTNVAPGAPPALTADASRDAAVKAACEYSKLMSTYDYADGDGWQSKVLAGATGTWKTQAGQLLPAIRLLLEADSEHTSAKDASCTVTSGNTTHYELDADITELNVTKGKADTTDHQKITMSMDFVDGKWLCSKWVSPLFPS